MSKQIRVKQPCLRCCQTDCYSVACFSRHALLRFLADYPASTVKEVADAHALTKHMLKGAMDWCRRHLDALWREGLLKIEGEPQRYSVTRVMRELLPTGPVFGLLSTKERNDGNSTVDTSKPRGR